MAARKGLHYAQTASNSQARIELTGAFFERDVQKTMDQNIRDMLLALAAEGQRTIQERSPRRTGAFVGGIVGRVESLRGAPWWQHAVVSATHVYPWHEHRGSQISRDGGRRGENRASAQYRGGKLEAKYHMFRAVAQQMRSGRTVLAANLTKGLE
jgi:hypothetical protein